VPPIVDPVVRLINGQNRAGRYSPKVVFPTDRNLLFSGAAAEVGVVGGGVKPGGIDGKI
jgi:hypothetical protein